MFQDAAFAVIEAWDALGFTAQRVLAAIVLLTLLVAAMVLGE